MIDAPHKILAQLVIHEGSCVIDFGAGFGAYSLLLSDIVGQKGTVFAVDVQRHLIDKIKRDSNELGKKNIYPMYADVEKLGGVPLQANLADYIFIVNVLNEVVDKRIVFEEAKRLLKLGGRLIVVDHENTPLPGVKQFKMIDCEVMAKNAGFHKIEKIIEIEQEVDFDKEYFSESAAKQLKLKSNLKKTDIN
jgi:ubiquinone/menaquinone biosynthesis C-methylase UbiE